MKKKPAVIIAAAVLVVLLVAAVALILNSWKDTDDRELEIINKFKSFDNSFFAVAGDTCVSFADENKNINYLDYKYEGQTCDVENCDEDGITLVCRCEDNGNWTWTILRLPYDGGELQLVEKISDEEYDSVHSVSEAGKFSFSGKKIVRPYLGDCIELYVTENSTGTVKTIDRKLLDTCDEGKYINSLSEYEYYFDRVIEKDGRLYVVGCLPITENLVSDNAIVTLFEYDFETEALNYCSSIHYTDSGAVNYYF